MILRSWQRMPTRGPGIACLEQGAHREFVRRDRPPRRPAIARRDAASRGDGSRRRLPACPVSRRSRRSRVCRSSATGRTAPGSPRISSGGSPTRRSVRYGQSCRSTCQLARECRRVYAMPGGTAHSRSGECAGDSAGRTYKRDVRPPSAGYVTWTSIVPKSWFPSYTSP